VKLPRTFGRRGISSRFAFTLSCDVSVFIDIRLDLRVLSAKAACAFCLAASIAARVVSVFSSVDFRFDRRLRHRRAPFISDACELVQLVMLEALFSWSACTVSEPCLERRLFPGNRRARARRAGRLRRFLSTRLVSDPSRRDSGLGDPLVFLSRRSSILGRFASVCRAVRVLLAPLFPFLVMFFFSGNHLFPFARFFSILRARVLAVSFLSRATDDLLLFFFRFEVIVRFVAGSAGHSSEACGVSSLRSRAIDQVLFRDSGTPHVVLGVCSARSPRLIVFFYTTF